MGKRLFWIDRKMMALWNYMWNMFVMPTDAKKTHGIFGAYETGTFATGF